MYHASIHTYKQTHFTDYFGPIVPAHLLSLTDSQLVLLTLTL